MFIHCGCSCHASANYRSATFVSISTEWVWGLIHVPGSGWFLYGQPNVLSVYAFNKASDQHLGGTGVSSSGVRGVFSTRFFSTGERPKNEFSFILSILKGGQSSVLSVEERTKHTNLTFRFWKGNLKSWSWFPKVKTWRSVSKLHTLPQRHESSPGKGSTFRVLTTKDLCHECR